jgi:RNA polymerase sigma-70 factor (ECF subfamily)
VEKPAISADIDEGRGVVPAHGKRGPHLDGTTQSIWMDEDRELELVTAAQDGNRDAYRELIEHYERSVYRLAYALTRHHDDAASLAIETFVRGWAEIGRLPNGKRFFPWLLRFARNLSVTLARRRAEATAHAEGPRDPSLKKDPRIELEQRLLDAVPELRPQEQMALALRIGEHLSYSEIATILQHTPGETMSRLSSARALLLTKTCEGMGDLT